MIKIIKKMFKNNKNIVLIWLAAILAWLITNIFFRMIRLRTVGTARWNHLRKKRKGTIVAGWHGNQLFGMFFFRYKGVRILNSLSRDGDYSSRLMRLYGWRSIRGSSNRGAVRGLLEMVRELRQGNDVGITPDGPRGPLYAIEPGIIYMAQKTGSPIIPVGMAFSRRLILSTWDKFMIPLPFGKGVVVLGRPLYLPPSKNDEEFKEQVQRVASALHEANRIAEERLKNWLPSGYLILYNFLLIMGHAVVRLGKAFVPALRRIMFLKNKMKAQYPKRALWYHAASVGEVGVIKPVYERLTRLLPDAPGIFSTVTTTGYENVVKMNPEPSYWPFPLDHPFLLDRWMKTTRPRIIILAETEIWPNMFFLANRHDIPIVIVNARISDRAWQKYNRFRGFFRYIFNMATHVFVQSEADAGRFKALGMLPEKLVITGNIKFDQMEGKTDENELLAFKGRFGITPSASVLIAGSVHPGELSVLLKAYVRLKKTQPDLRLIIAPRHLEKLPQFLSGVEAAGFKPLLYSGKTNQWNREILFIDAYGKLRNIYGLANLAFVGGSFVPVGGHNPLEPLRWGVPVIMGPRCNNIRDIVNVLEKEGLLKVVGDEDGFFEAAQQWLGQSGESRREFKNKAIQVLARQRGATDKTVQGIVSLMEE